MLLLKRKIRSKLENSIYDIELNMNRAPFDLCRDAAENLISLKVDENMIFAAKLEAWTRSMGSI
jgi:hypothetical protein